MARQATAKPQHQASAEQAEPAAAQAASTQSVILQASSQASATACRSAATAAASRAAEANREQAIECSLAGPLATHGAVCVHVHSRARARHAFAQRLYPYVLARGGASRFRSSLSSRSFEARISALVARGGV